MTGKQAQPSDQLNAPKNKETLQSAPMHRKVRLLMALFVFSSLLMFGMVYLSVTALDNIRAYVRGENLWAKAQKDAVFSLYQYSITRDPHLYDAFINRLNVNQGDKKARLALSEEVPALQAAYQGFADGENHPDDIPGLVNFFIYFKNQEHMSKAIEIWARADEKITELQGVATQIHAAIQANESAKLTSLTVQLNEVSEQLNQDEVEFSAVLGEGARWIKQQLIIINLAVLGALLLLILITSKRIGNQLRRTETELRLSDNRYTSLVNANLIGIIEWELNGKIHAANDKFLTMLGYSHDTLDSRRLNWRALTPEDQYEGDKKAIMEIESYGVCSPYEKEFFHRDGHRVPVFIGAVLLRGETQSGIAFVVDQTDKKRLENELRLSSVVMESCQDGILVVDEKGLIISTNSALCAMLGVSESGLIHKPVSALYECNEKAIIEEVDNAFTQFQNWQGDVEIVSALGERQPVRFSVSTVNGDHLRYGHYVVFVSDIRERKMYEANLERKATHDPLTGLANRSLYVDLLEHAILKADRTQGLCGVIYLDLDKFKPVNDTFGHEVGDKLLQQVANRVSGLMRSSDLVARLGGDEFAVVVEGITGKSILGDLAQRIARAVSRRYDIDGHEIHISCSMGTSLYPNDGRTVSELTRAADVTMYEEKVAKPTS